MRNYYFLAPSLPPIALGVRPEIGFAELKGRLGDNLSKEDMEQFEVLLRFTDILNIRSLLMEEPIDPRGNLSEKELDEAILVSAVFLDYVFDFLEQFEGTKDRIRNFSALLARFFSEEIPKLHGFLKTYFVFERQWRLILVALRSKQLQRDVVQELQFEDLTDPMVAQILAQKDADQYEPPLEYMDLKELVISCAGDPWQEHKAFAEYRFKKIAEMVEGSLFSLDLILAYVAQLMILEYWNELDEEKGRMILDTYKPGTSSESP
jgi:hypothetical protein